MNRHIKHIALVLLLFYSLNSLAWSNIFSRHTFSSLTVEDGLPINFIEYLSLDSKGFLWVSTQGGGLVRYDGYEFVLFNTNGTHFELRSNNIRQTYEDVYNRLWIISDAGIDIVDLSTMQNINGLFEQNLQLKKIMNSPATSIYNDSKNNLWIVNDGAISKVVFSDKGEVEGVYSLSPTTIHSKSPFSSVCEINEEIWIGSHGVFKIEQNQAGYLVLYPVNETSELAIGGLVTKIYKAENTVWLGTEYGLWSYNIGNKTAKNYRYSSAEPYSLSQDMVTDISQMSDGRLVVSTLRGLNFFDSSTETFERIYHSNETDALNNDFVSCLLPNEDNLWIGTEGGGINIMSNKSLDVTNYKHNDINPSSLVPNPVNAIIEDYKGNLWVGNMEGGLSLLDKKTNKFKHYQAMGSIGSLSHNSVSVLEEDVNHNLWIGTWGGGLNVLDLKKQPHQFTYEQITTPLAGEMAYTAVLKYDSINNGLWVGSNRSILFYNIATKELVKPLSSKMTDKIKGVLGSLIDDKNQLWLGCSEGIIVVDLKSFNSKDFTCESHFFHVGDKDSDKLFEKNVSAIYQTKDKSIWIGSKGYGLRKLTTVNGEYETATYTIEHGLSNNIIFGILEDEEGLIWVSTGYGLSCYNAKLERFVNFTTADGLIDNQFFWNASFKSPTSHELYFGSMCGLTRLGSRHQFLTPTARKVIFTKLKVLNDQIWQKKGKYIDKDIAYADKLTLHEKDKSFSLEFSSLDYNSHRSVVYSYRLLGFDDNWIETPDNRRFVNYTNLRPGLYTLQVRAMSRSLGWTEDVTELQIEVIPFFYKRAWFIALCLLLVFFIAFQFYSWRIRNLKEQKELLHKKVTKRTHELKEQNEILVEQNKKIDNQRLQLIKMSEQVEEAMADKITFFTNITHEFRTPITLITGPIDRALKLSANPKVVEQLQYVQRNSRYLLSLVNQLMDFRKVETDNMTFTLKRGNFSQFLDETLLSFQTFGKDRGIDIRKLERISSVFLELDYNAIYTVITNLLSNAIKFSPDNSSITLYAATLTKRCSDEKLLYICVSDAGEGIKEEEISKIFDHFYQSKSNVNYPTYGQSGTGIGLYLCKKIVTLLGGDVSIKNNQKKGTAFRILLPVNLDIQSGNERLASNSISSLDSERVIDEEPFLAAQRLSILVVEDNKDMRNYIASILSEYYNVQEAENGEDALKILKNNSTDFIISDMMMPVMDGLEFSRRVKENFETSHIPFLMLTAKTSSEAEINSYKVGVNEFIHKPFNEELLLTRIKNMIESRKLYQRKFSLSMNRKELDLNFESQDQKFINKALETIKENYQNPAYDVNDFVTALGASQSLVNSKMKTLLGQTSGQFIRNYRLKVSHEIILENDGEFNVSDVAYQVGFNDPKYFTRCFSKQYGYPPSELLRRI